MIPEIERQIESILGNKREGVYILADNITVKVEEQNGGIYLWIEDRRGENAYGWIFNIEKTKNGYKYISDHDYQVVCDSLKRVFEIVKSRKK